MTGNLPSTDQERLRVFLCHASEDKPAVRALYQRLKESGFDPWLDEEDLIPGTVWPDEIEIALEESHAVVVCLSHHSVKEGFLQKEMREALAIAEEKAEGAVFLIPVKLEEVPVPRAFRRLHWADLNHPKGYDRLVAALHKRAGQIARMQKPVPPVPVEDGMQPPRGDLTAIPAVPSPDPQRNEDHPPPLFAPAPRPSRPERTIPIRRPVRPNPAGPSNAKTTLSAGEKVGAVVLGGILLAAATYLALQHPEMNPPQWILFLLFAALGTACIGALIPGVLEVKVKGYNAGGAAAFFVATLLLGNGIRYVPNMVMLGSSGNSKVAHSDGQGKPGGSSGSQNPTPSGGQTPPAGTNPNPGKTPPADTGRGSGKQASEKPGPASAAQTGGKGSGQENPTAEHAEGKPASPQPASSEPANTGQSPAQTPECVVTHEYPTRSIPHDRTNSCSFSEVATDVTVAGQSWVVIANLKKGVVTDPFSRDEAHFQRTLELAFDAENADPNAHGFPTFGPIALILFSPNSGKGGTCKELYPSGTHSGAATQPVQFEIDKVADIKADIWIRPYVSYPECGNAGTEQLFGTIHITDERMKP